ncbi:DUF397 domain-containing protein [Spirillospora sp. NPDC047279]|uniref:DUF397 domain-containing protein n=1 Tax=Spirillospora sp. NPDC047279 TaxID=3155478 RepID=UPI0033DAE6E0
MQYEFRQSSACSDGCGGACVEVAINLPGIVALRDSKTDTTVQFTPEEWGAFLAGVKAGEFDIAA